MSAQAGMALVNALRKRLGIPVGLLPGDRVWYLRRHRERWLRIPAVVSHVAGRVAIKVRRHNGEISVVYVSLMKLERRHEDSIYERFVLP